MSDSGYTHAVSPMLDATVWDSGRVNLWLRVPGPVHPRHGAPFIEMGWVGPELRELASFMGLLDHCETADDVWDAVTDRLRTVLG